MSKLFIVFALCVYATQADLLIQKENEAEAPRRSATLKPLSVCCDIPEMGNPKHLASCSNPKLSGLCNEVQCIFEQSGFLNNKETLNKDAYINHLRQWAEKNKGWNLAVEKAINDCVETDPRQHLEVPCKAYDVFTCTGIAMLKKCPDFAWKC